MNNQEIQIIVGILLLLVYVYCIRNNEGYRRRGRTSCQTRAVSGRRIYKRVRPFRRCGSGRRGYISELKRVITPIPRGRVPVNNGRTLGRGVFKKKDLKRIIYKYAKMGADYMIIQPVRNEPRSGAIFFKGASTATRPMRDGPGVRKYRILPPGRARAGRRGAFSRFIQRCKNMFRRRKIPVGDTPQMRARRASLTPQQWARDDKL